MSQLLPIKSIKQDSALQPRAKMDTAIIDEYTESMKAGASFPPVVVFDVKGEYYLVDGYHRFLAIQGAKFDKILADIKTGTMREAILFSTGANATHGLRRTNDDKRRAVLTLLRDKEWSAWSNVQIAKASNVSDEFVRKIRAEIQAAKSGSPAVSSNVGKIPSKKVTVERSGKTYKMDTKKIGKSTEPKKEDPLPVSPYVPQPGSIEVSGKVQPSLAEQQAAKEYFSPEYLKKYPVTAACVQSECEELFQQRPGLYICKLVGMRPENIAGQKCPKERTQEPGACTSPPAPEPGIIPAPRKAPCLLLQPCPDGQDHILTDGKGKRIRCKLWSQPFTGLPKDECWLDVEARKKAKEAALGFNRASDDIDPWTGGRIIKPTANKSGLPTVSKHPLLKTRQEQDVFCTTFIDNCLTDRYHRVIRDAMQDHDDLQVPLDVLCKGLDLLAEYEGE